MQHPPGLRHQNHGLMQIAGNCMAHELVIRHAGPKEVTQAACQPKIREWGGRLARFGRLGPIQELG